jgi:zinc D-Ala-D-Ala carboxypeptidase
MLQRTAEEWRRYGDGRRWRCIAPARLCEVDDAGRIPSLLGQAGIRNRLVRIHAFLDGRLQYGSLDAQGNALDIVTANAMTESYGTVPSPLQPDALDRLLDARAELPLDLRLDAMLRQIGKQRDSRWLVRFEPGYGSPVATPGRVSVGSHHMLLSTLQGLPSERAAGKSPEVMRRQCVQLAADALYAAQRAIEYLNARSGAHQHELPLIAACYNAGSLRASRRSHWNLVEYGEHIDRWIAYYNASRQARGAPARVAPTVAAAAASDTPAAALHNAARLSAHFSLAEMTRSDVARTRGIDNTPGPEASLHLRRLAERLEQVRQALGSRPLLISSAFRCPALNAAVGSRPGSRHVDGLAADFTCPTYGSPLRVAAAIAGSGIAFDQLIHEHGRWVHFGLARDDRAERRQTLTIDARGARVGLHAVRAG